jgi:aconitate hydratase
VLPLQYANGATAESLGLDGTESFTIALDDSITPKQTINVVARKADGKEITFDTMSRIDTLVEIDYYRNGGILQTVLRSFLRDK